VKQAIDAQAARGANVPPVSLSVAATDEELTPGAQITPHLQLVTQLGRGGMGTVWIAQHVTLRSRVVVKFMSAAVAENPELRARFSIEAAAASQVKSPHVVQLFDYGLTERGTPYIVMELLEGIDLGRHLDRRGRMSLAETAVIVCHVARALLRAHDRGIIHRDIKPENIFLCDVGDDEIFAKVFDFGIAKHHDPQVVSNLTRTGFMVGTPYYMAPEQMLNGVAADHRADLWALAVVAYEAMTGERPFEGECVATIALALTQGHEPPSAIIPCVPPEVDRWFARAFAPNAEDRFADAKEMADALLRATETRPTMPPSMRSVHDDDLTEDALAPTCELPQHTITLEEDHTPVMNEVRISAFEGCGSVSAEACARVLAELSRGSTSPEIREARARVTTSIERRARRPEGAALVLAQAASWYTTAAARAQGTAPMPRVDAGPMIRDPKITPNERLRILLAVAAVLAIVAITWFVRVSG